MTNKYKFLRRTTDSLLLLSINTRNTTNILHISSNNTLKLVPVYLSQPILAQCHLSLLALAVVNVPPFLVTSSTGLAHLVAVVHLVVEFIGLVKLQFLGIG